MNIAITGASGLVGSRIIELLSSDFTFLPIAQEQCDITEKNSVKQTINGLDFDLFLHLAAYTDVDGAQKHPEVAQKVNVEGTRNVFEVVQKKGKRFIYVSTGFVFDGNHPPYDESSAPNPLSVYGQTKYEGEKIVGRAGMIVRIEYPYRAQFEDKKDFVKTIRDLLSQNRTPTMVSDSLMTLTFIDDIAAGLKYLFNNYSPEVFHLVGADSLSPYQAGQTIADVFGFDKKLIQPTTYDEYFKERAKRPRYSQIVSKKNTFQKMSTFEEGLSKIKAQLPTTP